MNSYVTILIFLIFVAVALSILIYWITRFKHRLIIHKRTGSKSIDHIIKFKVTRDRDGVEWWIPFKLKKIFGKQIKPAPPKSVMITPKGNMSISCTWDGFKKFQWLIPEFNPKSEYEVLTDEQKAIYLKMMRDSQTWQKKSFAELFTQIASVGAVVIIAVSLMIFYGDMAQPLLDMSGQLQTFQDKQMDMMQMFQEVLQNKKWVDETYIPPDAESPPPPD